MESGNRKTEKLRRPMTAKRWVLSFAGGMAFVMLLIALVNYIVDPFSYFRTPVREDRGTYTYDWNAPFRLLNYHYFAEHYQEYSGVILGGSKGMYIEESYLSQVSGEKYCQLAARNGSFHDYLDWVRWIADNTNIRHIFLNLSTLEVEWYTPEERDEEKTGNIEPAALDRDKNIVIEFIQYLYRGGIEPSLRYLKAKKDGSLWLLTFFGATNTDPSSVNYQNWTSDLNWWLDRSANGIYDSMPAIERNLTALREIKELCDESGIQLSVVVAPTSTIQYLQYECPEYWDYLSGMAQIVDYWDFSMPNAINRNRYNFVDYNHLFSEALRHMLDQIYGTEPDDGSGAYVTAENVEEYIAERQRRYNALMEEYAETGTVRQGMYFDEGYLMSQLHDPILSNTSSAWAVNVPLKDCLNITQHFYASFDHLEGVGIFPEGVFAETENLGNLTLQVYDDTGKHTLFSGDIDLSEAQNGREHYIRMDGLELTEGHWYSLIFSYEPKVDGDWFSLQCVDSESTGTIYMEQDGVRRGYMVQDGVWREYELKMDLFHSQTYGNYRQKDAVLQTDKMRGEGEGETRELTEQTRYTQTFTADCDLLSYIQLKTSHLSDPEEPEPADNDYSVILELSAPDGTLMSKKTIMASVLQNSDVYNAAFDGDLYLNQGETYELTIYANKTTAQGLKLLTHGEESGSVLYLNGVKTGESLCYRVYGINEG